jgi:hypothetical protein
MPCNVVTFIPGFVKIGELIHRLKWKTNRQPGVLIKTRGSVINNTKTGYENMDWVKLFSNRA